MPRESEVRREKPLPRYELESWRDRFGIVAGVTGREADFRLTARSEESTEEPAGRLARLPAVLEGFQAAVASRQRHGTEIAVHGETGDRVSVQDGFDGHLTRRPGLLLAVTVADCIPVYLVHPPTATIVLLHAGWRGAASGIVEQGLRVMCYHAATTPGDLVMHCGVGICGVCYEVGHEVLAAVRPGAVGSAGRLDLRHALAERASALGIGAVTVSAWCTAHDHDRFHSHRRSGGHDGRMVAYLGRPAG